MHPFAALLDATAPIAGPSVAQSGQQTQANAPDRNSTGNPGSSANAAGSASSATSSTSAAPAGPANTNNSTASQSATETGTNGADTNAGGANGQDPQPGANGQGPHPSGVAGDPLGIDPSSAPSPQGKSAGTSGGDAKKDAASGDEGSATAGSQAPGALPAQLVAAVVVNATVDTTSAAAHASASATNSAAAIGEQSKARGKAAALFDPGSAPAPGQGPQDPGNPGTPGTPGAPGTPGRTGTAVSSTSIDSGANASALSATSSGAQTPGAGAQTPGAGAVQQAQAAATDPAAVNGTNAGSDIDRVAARVGTSDATVSTDQTGTSSAPKTMAAAAPETALNSFGFLNAAVTPATSAAATTATATTGTDSAGAVPIAGLPIAIAARAQEGSNQFEIRLDPPELGRIDVQLSVDGNGQVTSHVTVDRADTLALLQNQQPHLERALEQAGLKTADNGLSFTLRDQSFTGQNNNNNGGAPQSSQTQIVVPDSDLPAAAATQAYSRIGLGGGVDIRV